MEFKNWLAQQMSEKGLAQAELSRMSKVPQPTIQRILSGETSDPRGSTIEQLKKALGYEEPVKYGGILNLSNRKAPPKADIQLDAIEHLSKLDEDEAELWLLTAKLAAKKLRAKTKGENDLERNTLDPPLEKGRISN